MIKFNFSDFLYPHRLLYWRHLLWKTQFQKPEILEKLQWKLFSDILDHCFNKVPYYQQLFHKIGLKRADFQSLNDLTRLPIIDRYVLLENAQQFKATDFNKYKPLKIRTSGTTGAPMNVYWDKGSNILELLCQYRHFSWSGYKLGDGILDIRSVVFQDEKKFKWNWKCKSLELSSDYINAENIDYYADLLRKYKIKLWRGYPQSIDYLCRLLNNAGIDDVKPQAVISVSVNILDYQRRFIETWTGKPLCDNYGSIEHIALICQCPHGGYHIAPEYGIVEIIKEDGTPAQPGEEGRIVATGLHNKAFPLLRYDTLDYAIASDKTCTCGRTLPLIEHLTGRINEFILTSNGKWVSGPHFPIQVANDIKKSQLIQENKNLVHIFIVPMEKYNSENDKRLIQKYKEKLGQDIEIKIFHVDEVPYPNPGKKYKFAYCKIKNKNPYPRIFQNNEVNDVNN